jgi:hypothetical protein
MQSGNDLPEANRKSRSYGFFSSHRAKGRWWFRVYGWGVRYKDARRHLPNYDERIKTVRNLKIGPHWFKLLRP